MKIAIRVDSSVSIGAGHVVRCLNFAKELRARGADVIFICRRLTGDYCEWIKSAGFRICEIYFTDSDKPNCDGVIQTAQTVDAWQSELGEIEKILTIESPLDWIIVDHYGIDDRWEQFVRKYAKNLAVIDDTADRRHDCDLLIDQNYFLAPAERYDGKLPLACRTLFGPSYSLLSSDYFELRKQVNLRFGKINNILIFFGGGDNNNLTQLSLSAFLSLEKSDISCDVVVGSSYPYVESLKEISDLSKAVTVHVGVPSLAPFVAKADLAIGGSGVNSWERCCLGLPAIVITLAENQIPVANELAKLGVVNLIGDVSDISEKHVYDALKKTVSIDLPESWSKTCFDLVDGLGVKRVADMLIPRSINSLIVRPVKQEDCELLLNWVNDPSVRQSSFNQQCISRKSHHAWFVDKVSSPDACRIYIIETNNGVPIGQVRFEFSEGFWVLDYSIDSLMRGFGFGVKSILLAIKNLLEDFKLNDVKVISKVLSNNLASHNVMQKIGYFEHRLGEGFSEYEIHVPGEFIL